MKRKVISPYVLVEKFHYSENSLSKLLYRLKKEGLVITMTRGSWELTEEGYRKLRYYGIKIRVSGLAPPSPLK